MTVAEPAADRAPRTAEVDTTEADTRPIVTGQDYIESLHGRGLTVYLFGERVEEPVDHPVIRPSINAVAENPETGDLLRKYLKGRADVPAETRMRLLRLIENMTLGRNAVGYLTESMHGAGSPQAQRIQIARQMELGYKKRLAERLAGVGGEVGDGGAAPAVEEGGYLQRVFEVGDVSADLKRS